MRKEILLVIMLVLSFSSQAKDEFVNGEFRFTIEDDKNFAWVSGYIGTSLDIVIPSSVQYKGKTYPITYIQKLKDLNIKSVVIPNSVTTIANGCFQNCKNLNNVILPPSVNRIYSSTFEGCTSLENITFQGEIEEIDLLAFGNCAFKEFHIPNSIKWIEAGAFTGCKKMQRLYIPASLEKFSNGNRSLHAFEWEVIVDSNNPNLCSEDGVLFNKDKTVLMRYPSIKTDKVYIIPNTVQRIYEFAFADCQAEKIVIPESITTIPEHAFYQCRNLQTIIIPNTVKEIGEAFYGCSQLKEVVFPDFINVYKARFFNCPLISNIKGHNLLYLDYVLNSDAGHYDNNSPFFKNVMSQVDNIKSSFSYYASNNVTKTILEWQKKKEYETTEQWKNRVTESNRQQKVNDLLEQARKEYVNQNTPKQFSGTLGVYDADYSTFPLKVGETQTLFINVPQSDAQQFKEKWNKVKIEPVYGIVNDHVGILSCSFTFKGKKYGLSQTYENDNSTNLAMNFSSLDLDLGNAKESKKQDSPKSNMTIDYSLDTNIPVTSANNTNTFAIIIGNEKYQQVAQVPFANNDARIFAEYCKKTLGMPEKNVKVYEDATYGTMIGAISDIQKIAKAFKGDINVIFYYAGHGIPDESTGDSYLLPIDADGLNIEVCYSLNKLYKQLGDLQARNVTAFMDACFSGSKRGNGMIVAARGVAIKAKNDSPKGNTIVFTAATDKQTAYPYEEKGHGMFTYYLIKKLRDTKGDCTLGELGSYICDEVAKQAIVTNGKEQTPVVLTSSDISDTWRNLKLK